MKKLIGYISVDSGQIMVLDPCYLVDWRGHDLSNDWYEKAQSTTKRDSFEFSYEGACMASCSRDAAGELCSGRAVCARTKYGDVSYPVFIVTNDCGRYALVVEMGNESDDDHEEEDC